MEDILLWLKLRQSGRGGKRWGFEGKYFTGKTTTEGVESYDQSSFISYQCMLILVN